MVRRLVQGGGSGAGKKKGVGWVVVVVVDDRFYTALFSALEQTHCSGSRADGGDGGA